MRAAWRVCKASHAGTALDGEGARRAGGRWNARGTRLVYTSESISLATLETLVHAGPGQLRAADLVLVEVGIPEELAIEEIAISDLPQDWRDYPPPGRLAQLGEAWIEAARTPLLRVPSAVVPREWNVLLNPVHPRLASVKVVSVAPFDPDPRLRR